jgi:hypothetical protein
LIIPYDTIETAEEKYGKRSNSKKRFRKGNMKSNEEKSYSSWIRGGKSPHSRQMSNPQKSSEHSSAQVSNKQQSKQSDKAGNP